MCRSNAILTAKALRKMRVLVCFLAVLVCVHGDNILGDLVKGTVSLGTDLGKQVVKTADRGVFTGATAVKDASVVTTGIGKVAIAGVDGLASSLLENTGDVANNAIGIIDVLGNHLGPIGQPLEDIGETGQEIVSIGVTTAVSGINKVSEVGTEALTAINNAVVQGSDAVIEATNKGSEFLDGLLDDINNDVDAALG